MRSKLLILSAIIILFSCFLFFLKQADRELKKQIGQMLIVGFRGTEISKDSYAAKAIKDLNLGGVILFDYDVPSKSYPRNIINPEQTKKLIQDLKGFSSSPLLVAVDAEGGLINRLKQRYGFIPIPSHQELGKKDNLEETERFSSFLAQELSLLGFNLNFAPVVDLNLNPENPVIGGLGRSFSEDPGKVFNHARAFISGQHKYGILTSIKHFPGHGSSKEDSHKGLVDVTDTYSSKELEPFQELIKSSMADLVMTAHIINRNIDPDYPATLSSRYIKEILRKEMGFQGVVVSDDLQMGAITENYGFEEALVRSINAGCNLLILSNNSIYDESIPYNAVEMIFKAVKDGRIEKSSITDSWSLIKKLKNKII